MYDERYVKNHRYQQDSDRLYRLLEGLHMQDEPMSAAQAKEARDAAESLSKGVAICNDREDLLRRRDLTDLFRFIDFAGKTTPLSMCEKVMYAMTSPAELRFMAGYFRSKGLAEASKEAAAKADERTLAAPDLSWATEGARPSHKTISDTVGQLKSCTHRLCQVYGTIGDDPLVLIAKEQPQEAGDDDGWETGHGLNYEL